MLDGILGRGFSAKCKSLMKMTRSRIDVVRRRAEAKQRFLNEDLAKLLSNGLDINAYGRTEEFLAGMDLLWSYDFVEQSCEYIGKQLSSMQKQGECPEECREAVASLMYAAARFSDLPELRELRDIFQQRYGSCIEAFVNKKLVEKLPSKPPPKEKRLQVLQDIASEFSIRWDSRGFERRMATPAIVAQVDEQRVDIVKQRQGPLVEKSRVRSYEEGNFQKRDEGDNHISRRKEAFEYKEKSVLKSGGSNSQGDDDLLYFGRSNISSHGKVQDNSIQKRDHGDNHISRKKEAIEYREKSVLKSGGSNSQGDDDLSYFGRSNISSHGKVQDNNIQKRDEGDNHISRRKEAIEYREKSLLKSGGSSSQGDDNLLYRGRKVFSESKHAYPIEKADADLNIGRSNVPSHWKVQDNNVHTKHSNGTPNPRIGESRSTIPSHNSSNQDNTPNSIKKGVDEGSDRLKNSSYALPPPYIKSNQNTARPPPYVKPEEDKHKISRDSKHGRDGHFTDPGHEKELDYPNDKFPLPKPRSLRRKHNKPSSSHKVVDAVEDVKRSSSRRKEHSRKGLQILFDDEHHVNDDEEKMIDKLLIHYSKKPSNFDAGNLRKKSREHQEESSLDQSRNGPGPIRSVSLPTQQADSPESNKVFARSNTFQEDNQARHVHPKLPNYDDLAARFAALKGR